MIGVVKQEEEPVVAEVSAVISPRDVEDLLVARNDLRLSGALASPLFRTNAFLLPNPVAELPCRPRAKGGHARSRIVAWHLVLAVPCCCRFGCRAKLDDGLTLGRRRGTV